MRNVIYPFGIMTPNIAVENIQRATRRPSIFPSQLSDQKNYKFQNENNVAGEERKKKEERRKKEWAGTYPFCLLGTNIALNIRKTKHQYQVDK